MKENKYKKCYQSCESCDKEGTKSNHNCISCSNEYLYELKILNGINCYKECDYYFYYNSYNNKYYCTNSSICPKNISELLIQQKNQCIDDCSKDPEYRNEFRKKCYKECPKNISKKSKTREFYCEPKCPKEYPYEIVETQICVKNCSIAEKQKGLCKVNYEQKDEKENKEIEEKVIEDIRKEIAHLDTSDIDKGKNIIIEQKDSIITISSTEYQKKDNSLNITEINLYECENKLREYYKIPKNNSLYILQLEVKQPGFKIPKIEYRI